MEEGEVWGLGGASRGSRSAPATLPLRRRHEKHLVVSIVECTRLGICSLWQRAREHVAPARGGRVGHTELEVSDGAVGEAAASAVRVLQRSDSGDCAKVVDQLLHIATVGTDRTVARVPVNRPLSTVIADASAAAGVERGRRGHIR